MKKYIINLVIFSLTLLAIGCSKKNIKKETRPIPVTIARAVSKNVPNYIKTVGHMEAFNSVNIMAQANGQLLKIYFNEGDYIKKGDLLFLIDQRPYLASLKQAQGALEESVANMMYAQRTAERNSKLVQDEYISQNKFDQLVTNVEADKGIVKENEGTFDTAEIKLSYTTIYSPIDAIAGEKIIYEGDLILENAETKLLSLNQITPIYCTFFINEKALPQVQRYQNNSKGLTVFIFVEDPEIPPYSGTLTFIDNSIDLSTGMIKLKATLKNTDRILWPNQYVQVKLLLNTIDNAILIPFDAVQNNSKGKYVYVVKGNQSVEMRMVEVGEIQEDNTIVITTGLKERERVVTEGQFSLYNGAKVKIIKNPNEDD